jgi:hypothetical protein
MASPRIAGIFEDPEAAERAKEKLLQAGVALHRIVVSGERAYSTTRVLTVAARSPVECEHIAELMKRSGARHTVTPQ